MAARDYPCDIDTFAVSLGKLLDDVSESCDAAVEKAVTKSVRKTAKDLRGGKFGNKGKHEWSEEYMKGFTSYTSKRGPETMGEVGNKAKPGLVHLLEKGHLTLTSRRTTAYPHMAPAFDAASEEFVEQMNRSIGEALR